MKHRAREGGMTPLGSGRTAYRAHQRTCELEGSQAQLVHGLNGA